MALFLALVHSLLLSLLLIHLKKRNQHAPLAKFIVPAFCWKIMAGIAYGWLYVIYYGGIGDSLNFFRDAGRLAAIAFENPSLYLQIIFFNTYHPIPDLSTGDLWLQPRAFILVKILSFFNLITANNYWFIGFYFSFFSFWGMWSLANTLVKIFPDTYYAAVLAFLFWPSVVFFSAGLSKESLVMAGIGLSLSRVLMMMYEPQAGLLSQVYNVCIFLIFGWMLWTIKFYYLAALFPPLIAYILTISIIHKFSAWTLLRKNTLLQLGLFNLVWLVLIIVGMRILPGLDLKSLMINIVSNHNVTYIFSRPDELIHYTIIPPRGYITISPTLQSFLYNTPQALFSALFRPFIWETGGNKLKIFIALENSALLLLSLYALFSLIRGRFRATPSKLNHTLLIWTVIFYMATLYTLLAFASPNFGSLVRYKIAAAPFLIYLIHIDFLSDLERFFYKIFPQLKKNQGDL